MAGAEIANAYVALTVKMPGVKGDVESLLGGAAGQRSGSLFSAGFAGAVGGTVASVATKAMESIAASVDGAISRVDTLNNFPKIMENLGYSASDASDSITTMSDELTGLPTSLDQMAGAVQQLAPLTGSLSEATDLSLAFNNALLAGGKSTDIQANALEQYTQMLSAGKVDMQAWRSIVTAMPGQVDQLAQSLLGAGAGQMDLYDALQEGTLGFDDFNAAIVHLNAEGTGEFASFADQAAAATDGIGTSMANLGTSITRNLANIVEPFAPLISDVASTVGSALNEVGHFLAPVAEAIASFISDGDLLIPILSGIAVVIGGALVAAVWSFTAALLANPITWITLAIAALVAAIVWLVQNWDTVVAWITEIWSGFISWITDVITGFVGWWNGIWGAVGRFISDVWNSIVRWVTDKALALTRAVLDGVAGIQRGWENMWTSVGDFLRGIWNNILGWIEGGVNGAIDLINGLLGGLSGVAAFIGIDIGTIPHISIPRLADGGIVQATRGGTLATIGEGRYDEAVIPLSPQVLSQIGGGSGDTYVVENVRGATVEEVADQLLWAKRRASLGGKYARAGV